MVKNRLPVTRGGQLTLEETMARRRSRQAESQEEETKVEHFSQKPKTLDELRRMQYQRQQARAETGHNVSERAFKLENLALNLPQLPPSVPRRSKRPVFSRYPFEMPGDRRRSFVFDELPSFPQQQFTTGTGDDFRKVLADQVNDSLAREAELRQAGVNVRAYNQRKVMERMRFNWNDPCPRFIRDLSLYHCGPDYQRGGFVMSAPPEQERSYEEIATSYMQAFGTPTREDVEALAANMSMQRFNTKVIASPEFKKPEVPPEIAARKTLDMLKKLGPCRYEGEGMGTITITSKGIFRALMKTVRDPRLRYRGYSQRQLDWDTMDPTDIECVKVATDLHLFDD